MARARKARSRSARLDAAQEEQAEDELHQAEEQLADAEDETAKPSWREVLADLRWTRIAAAAGAIFVAAMLIIVTFELVTGRAVSTYTGGTDGNPRTSIPGLGRPVDGYAGPDPDPDRDVDRDAHADHEHLDADLDTEHAESLDRQPVAQPDGGRDPDHGPDDDPQQHRLEHRPDAHARTRQAPPAADPPDAPAIRSRGTPTRPRRAARHARFGPLKRP